MSYINQDGNRRSSRNEPMEQGVDISNTINDANNDAPGNTNDNTPSSHTSNAFSYEASSSLQLEPTEHQNEPSSHNLHTPYPIPIASTSHPTLSSSIALDPVIQQLQTSLRMMSSRIDTIQETTEHRFTDMQTQYEKGQHSLQEILKQGLMEMNKHRNEERAMMQEIRAHQANEPPARSVLVQENRSSTSSLGDPPASNHITTSPLKSPSVISAPDPPEEISPTCTKPNPSTNKLNTTKPSFTTKSTSNQPSVIVNPPTQVSTQHGTQTIIVQTDKDPKPMNFPLLTSTKGYIQFRAMCLAQSQSHPHFNTITTVKANGTLAFNQQMSKQESSQLFFSTVKALGKESHLYVSRDLFHTTDGYKLWNSLDDHFLRTASSVQSKDNLIAEYEGAYKKSDESFLLYLNKVENILEKLQFNGIPVGDLKTQSYKFLRGLKMNQIYGDILMNFENKSEWYTENMSLRQIALKAQIYHDEYTAIHGTSAPAQDSPSKPKPSPKANNKPTPKPTPKPGPSPAPAPPPSSTPQRTAVDSEVVRIKKIIQKANNKTAAIYSITREHEYDCPIHPNGKHNILNCYEFGNICESEDAFTAFNNVRTDLGLGPMTDRANRQYPPRFQSDINNNRFPVQPRNEPARRVQSDANPYAALSENEETGEADTSQSSNNNINVNTQPYSAFINLNNISKHSSPPLIQCRYSHNSSSTHPPALEAQNVYKAVIDSGASHHMTNIKSAFESITPFDHTQPLPQALMGDDETTLNIEGYGWMNINIHGKQLRLLGFYVPKLGVTLLSVKQHVKYQGCYFHAESNQATLAYPSFVIYPSTKDEIQVLFKPAYCSDSTTLHFNQQTALECKQKSTKDQITESLHMFPKSMQPYLPKHQQVNFQQTVYVQKLVPTATIPTQGTKHSIGYDVTSVMDIQIEPGEIRKVPTGLSTSLPKGLYLRIAPRSSLALQHLTVEGGVVDPDYRGEIQVIIKNHSTQPYQIKAKQKIAQFIFENASTPFLQVSKVLPPSSRTGGFGSTDKLNESSIVRLAKTHNQENDEHQSSPQSLTLPSTIVKPPASASINSATPKIITMTKETLDRSLGFRRVNDFLKHMKTVSTPTLKIQKDQSPKLDPGETASMKSSRRNTQPLEIPANIGDVWHLDIGFGPCPSIGGYKYTLMAVDRHSRYKLIYGLKNLKASLLEAMKSFLCDCGPKPKLIRTDFDYKIMGGKVGDLLKDQKITIQSSPPYRQHQNGLVERHWQEVVAMSRNWLTSSMLPSKFWYHAVKRAAEVCNILPTHHLKNITTPFEIMHKTKVDYRQLFPMFSVAYIKHVRDKGGDSNKWKSKSLKCIAVGQCDKSDGLLFYHPPSKQTFTCGEGYKFDTFSPSGPQFELPFDGNFTLSTQSVLSGIHRPPTHEEGATVYLKTETSFIPSIILSVPVDDDNDHYVIQEKDSGNIHEVLADEVLDHNPNEDPTLQSTTVPFPHLSWIKHNAKATLYLSDRMAHPKQGFLQHKNEKWIFVLGHKTTNQESIELKDLDSLAESLVHNKKLFQGWKARKHVIAARHARATSNVIARMITIRKISAKGLSLLQAPTLLKHKTLDPNDEHIWNEAYRSEYEGLQSIDTWEVISEDEFQSMKHLSKGLLPTMAIATIKYDGDGKPDRAKYRIVALGNLDPNQWSKSECFAPVLSQLELRFLIALATRQKCIPKTGDVNQAFCQSCLPPDEYYVCKPPPGCPISKPKSYWKLKKTLYGLKRSPRHFYELARKILKSIGLKQHPSSPCIFYGTLIEGEPPLYLGLYVDDFIYFSASPKVEEKFKKDFGDNIDTDFNGQIGYFLGINFECKKDEDGDVTIHMGQEAFVDNLCQMANLDNSNVTIPPTPYRSGHPTDSIPYAPLPNQKEQDALIHEMQVYIGCLTWLAMSTRPDIATITNILAKYTTKCTKAHITQVKRVIRYLKGTKSLGIQFTSKQMSKIESHVKFPIDNVTSMCDANWGPQDQSRPSPNETQEVDLFKSRSLSGFLIYLNGPLHWVSKRQTITARSTAEAEIYATDECTKCLLHLYQIVDGLNLTEELMDGPTYIYNDNAACVQWSKNMTTKGLRHVQIRENAVRESVQNNFIEVKHIPGRLNLSDMFTKEDKDSSHFITIRDLVLADKTNLV
jgi:deoxyuridine 5'-triphosphate nucleotidohydrolase